MAKRNIILIIFILVLLIIQASLIPGIFSMRPLPQLILVFIIAWTILVGFREVLPWTILMGFLYDILFYNRVGIEVIFLVLIIYFVSFFSRRFLVENKSWGIFIMMLFVVAATFMHRLFSFFLHKIGTNPPNSAARDVMFNNISLELLFNIILFFVCFWMIKKYKFLQLNKNYK
jgi:rod shape-determining protein MreD